MNLILLITCIYLFLCGYSMRTSKRIIPDTFNIFLILFLPPSNNNNLV